jgi:type IV pilus assembly protein PilC
MATLIKVRKSYQKEGFNKPVFEYRSDWPYISIGFGDERDYFVENLSMLIASGMGIASALEALRSSVKSWKMKRKTKQIEDMVDAGMPLWKAFTATNILPERVVALIRSGEESGKLPEHLNLVTLQQHKEKMFRSRLRSALIYPAIVIFIAVVVGLGSAWLVLPNLVSIFKESQGVLPLNTRILIWLGDFFGQYGSILLPGVLGAFLLVVLILFFVKKTKFIGDAILFRIPGIKTLVQGVELSRLGYVLGAMLQAGFQINESLNSVKQGTIYRAYEKFYSHIEDSIMHGESFKNAITSYKHSDRYIPTPIQQLIISSEKSGRLPETFMKIGIIFEEKTEAMSQDLATVLEPIVLVVVGLIVALIVSGIIGPIYGLSNQI